MSVRAWLWVRLTKWLLGTDDVGMAGSYLVTDVDAPGEMVADLLDLPAYRDPVTELRDLPDERGRVYVWEVDRPEAADNFWSALVEQGADNADAIHVVIADETELYELDAMDLEPYIGGAGN